MPWKGCSPRASMTGLIVCAFVDEPGLPGLQVLSNLADAAAETNILPVARRGRSLQGGVNAVSDEVERRTARHGDRRAGMMREHEYVGVIRRRVAPPAFPVVIWPVAANWTEHVAAEDPGADVLEGRRRRRSAPQLVPRQPFTRFFVTSMDSRPSGTVRRPRRRARRPASALLLAGLKWPPRAVAALLCNELP